MNVRCAIVRMRPISPRSLVLAHDLDERLFERLAPHAQLVERDAARDEPGRELGQSALVREPQSHDTLRPGNRLAASIAAVRLDGVEIAELAERTEPFEHGALRAAELELDVEALRRLAERELVDHASLLRERDPVAGRLDLAEQMRVQEHRRAGRTQLLDDAAHEHS